MPPVDVAEPSRRSAGRRSRILEAALACFNERGFTATTIEEICQRSGASVGSVYHHFGGKEGLAAALYVEGLRGYQRGFRDVLELDLATEARVRDMNEELFAATRRWLQPRVEAGQLRPLPLDLFYTLLIGPA